MVRRHRVSVKVVGAGEDDVAPSLILWRFRRVMIHHLVAPHVVVAPDYRKVVARYDVCGDHPSEHLFDEPPACCIALVPRSYAEWSKYRPAIFCLRPARGRTSWRQAPVHMLVPLCHAGGYPLVEIGGRVAFR